MSDTCINLHDQLSGCHEKLSFEDFFYGLVFKLPNALTAENKNKQNDKLSVYSYSEQQLHIVNITNVVVCVLLTIT